MRNKLFILILLASSFFQLHSLQSMNGALLEEGDNFGITIEPSFGYLIGQSREIVYDTANESTGGRKTFRGTLLSELIWDLTNILYTGGSVSFNYKNYLYVNGGAWLAINKGTGHMNDYDWINGFSTHERNGFTDVTHWSLSTVEVIGSLVMDYNIAYDFLEERDKSLSLVGGYHYIFWDWTDTVVDSYYNGTEDYLTTGISAIDYSIGLNIPYIGVSGGLYGKNGFSFKGRFIYSPFVIGRDHDHHLLRTDWGSNGVHFYDVIYGGQFFSGALKAVYQITPWFSINLQVNGDYLLETVGDTHVYDTYDGGEESYYGTISDGAGMQYQALSASLNLAFSF